MGTLLLGAGRQATAIEERSRVPPTGRQSLWRERQPKTSVIVPSLSKDEVYEFGTNCRACPFGCVLAGQAARADSKSLLPSCSTSARSNSMRLKPKSALRRMRAATCTAGSIIVARAHQQLAQAPGAEHLDETTEAHQRRHAFGGIVAQRVPQGAVDLAQLGLADAAQHGEPKSGPDHVLHGKRERPRVDLGAVAEVLDVDLGGYG